MENKKRMAKLRSMKKTMTEKEYKEPKKEFMKKEDLKALCKANKINVTYVDDEGMRKQKTKKMLMKELKSKKGGFIGGLEVAGLEVGGVMKRKTMNKEVKKPMKKEVKKPMKKHAGFIGGKMEDKLNVLAQLLL